MSEAMTINDIINQLGSLRASSAEFAKSDPESEIWKADVTACETAIRILAALSGEGCTDLETTINRGTIQLYCNHKTKKSVIAPDGFIYAWDDTRSIWATMRRAMRELDEMGIRYNDPFTGRYFDIPPHVDFDLDPTLWWAEASSGGGGGAPIQTLNSLTG